MQAQLAARYVRKRFEFSQIWSSDKRRCVQTAAALELPFKRTPTLREIDLGQWEGRSWSELQEESPEMAARYFRADPTFRVPGGEQISGVVDRGRRFMDEARLAEAEGDVAVVGHGGSLVALLVAMLDLPVNAMSKFHLDNCSVSVLDVAPGLIRLHSFNETDHLEGTMAGPGW